MEKLKGDLFDQGKDKMGRAGRWGKKFSSLTRNSGKRRGAGETKKKE